ncbi:MAG: HAD family hydrolase [Ardenticatenaceae bacterium]|nr:HAD family hydrolase [Ardenticatenaceae bacterium]MCB9442863.1 HAD family hydrolase [Ardenticatenaceae bacterium]
MARVTAVLFDFDDTLIDWSHRTQSWEEISLGNIGNIHTYLTQAGHKLPDIGNFHQRYHKILGKSWERANLTWESVCFATVLEETFTACNLDLNQINLNTIMQVYGWEPMPGVVPYQDTIPVLQNLHQNGYKIGLITNAMLPMWMRDIELRHYQLLDYFDVRLSSGDVGYIKPHPAIYYEALKQIDTRPEQAIFVGDRPAYDIAGANNAGMISVWMDPPHLNETLDGIKADYTITSLTELLPILEDLEAGD